MGVLVQNEVAHSPAAVGDHPPIPYQDRQCADNSHAQKLLDSRSHKTPLRPNPNLAPVEAHLHYLLSK